MPDIQFTSAGNRLNQISFLDTDGFPIGKTTTRPAVGTSTNGGMLVLPGAKNATPTVPNPSPVIDTGEDGYLLHEYNFPSDTSRGFEIQLAAQDLAQAMVVQNMPVTSYAGGRIGYEDIADVQLPNVCIILQSWAISVQNGIKKWSGRIIPSAQLAYLGRDAHNERTPGIFRYFATPNPASYDFLGYTIFDSAGVQKAARYLPFDNYDYPITIHAMTGNASATVFPTDFQPASSTVAAGVAAAAHAAFNRINQPITSVQTTVPYGVTFTSAPGNGFRGSLLYQFRS